MQYLLMCCFDEKGWMNLPDSQRDSIMSEYGRFVQEFKENGQYLAGAKLDQSARANTVRHKSGKPNITDGPFAETKEQLGGYHLVECKNREEAIELSLRIPTLPAGGAVEVRRVLSMLESDPAT